jgi:hypothetical protein
MSFLFLLGIPFAGCSPQYEPAAQWSSLADEASPPAA